MAQNHMMSDEEFCTMIHTWTGVDLGSSVGQEPKPEEKDSDNRPTIRSLLLSNNNKQKFFVLKDGNQKRLLKLWAGKCGLNSADGRVIALNATGTCRVFFVYTVVLGDIVWKCCMTFTRMYWNIFKHFYFICQI